MQGQPLPNDSTGSVGSIGRFSESDSPREAPSASNVAAPSGRGVSLGLYSVTIFLSAFLLFQIQPLIGKFILPWFGGTPGVWTTCMLVFQILLFGGYAYAHLTISRLSPRAQAVLHIALLLAACLALPIVPNLAWKPTGDEEPVSRIVLLLSATVGLPFFVLSATGPLLQGWFSRTHAGRSPYRLYALSNVGSLLALVSYPAVFDWTFATQVLAHLWSWSFAIFAVFCAACAVSVARRSRLWAQTGEPITVKSPIAAPSWGTTLLWFALAMVPSVLLLATTNQVCLDVASVPFLWVLPLTLYLLSFILCFDSEWWYSRRMMMPAAVVALACLYPVLQKGATAPFALQIIAYFTAFFLCAMVCHGELVRLKPDVKHLTSFYLVIAAGGAAGGIFVGIVAPLVFKNYYELHLGLFACAALMLVVLGTDEKSRLYRGRPWPVWFVLLVTLSGFAVALVAEARQREGAVVDVKRNFYGVLRVSQDDTEYGEANELIMRLLNGRIAHGFEYKNPALRAVPTSYYSPDSGIGRLLRQRSADRPMRVGLVGLGIGTLATYARPGDQFRFYEINPMVEQLARKYFHYLSDCRGTVDVIHGDARLTLDRETPQKFDVLVLDAFSGDAIPVHLLTVEAFEIYRRHLAADGVIAVHISNRHFALRPVVDAIADHEHLATAAIHSGDTSFGGFSSLWVLVSPDPKVLEGDRISRDALPADDRRVLWTDNHASLVEVLWLTSAKTLWSKTRESFSDLQERLFGAKKNGAPEEDTP